MNLYRQTGDTSDIVTESPIYKSWEEQQRAERILDDSIDPTKSEEIPSYIQEMNEKHGIVIAGNKVNILRETIDPLFNTPSFKLLTVQDFQSLHRNRKEPDPATKNLRNIATLWLESPFRREFTGITFGPKGEENGQYNLYKGLMIDPVKGSWTALQDHIYEVITDCNPGHADWLIKWTAKIVQEPFKRRHESAIALRGPQGTGKGIFARK